MYKAAGYWKEYVGKRGHTPLNHSSWVNNASETASGMVSADDPREFDYSPRPMEKTRPNKGIEIPPNGWRAQAVEQREKIIGYRPRFERDALEEGFVALFAGVSIDSAQHEAGKRVMTPVRIIENAIVPRAKTAFISR